MNRTRSDNLYRQCNYLLFPLIERYESWSDDDFNNVISKIGSLPKPNGSQSLINLQASRLGETLPNLLRKIERTEGVGGDPSPEVRTRIERLWTICQPLAVCFEVRGYIAFINAAIRKRVSPSLLESILATAKTNGVNISPEYFERLLAIGVKQAIKKRNLTHLKLTFEQADAVGFHFNTFNWGAFAKDSAEAEDEKIFELIWEKSGPSQFAFTAPAWVSFSSAAGQVEREDIIEQVWDAWLIHGDSTDANVWRSFANAASKVHSEALLEKIWEAFQGGGPKASANVWGALAKAAGRTGRGDLLQQFWINITEGGIPLDSAILGSFSYAAAQIGDGNLVEKLWEAYLKSDVTLGDQSWGAFAMGAAYSGRADLLRTIFNKWEPKPNTLMEGEHGTWGSFLGMAFHLRDELLLIEMFRRLTPRVDPIRLRHWGTISTLLWKITPQLSNKEIASEITETLAGLRLDVDSCFNTLEANEPVKSYRAGGDKPFEGAARCLMRWLINSYFICDNKEFYVRLSRLIDGFLSLSRNQEQAWLAFLGRSQETYFGCLRLLYTNCYKEHFSFIEELSDEQLLEEIKSGRIVEKLKNFEKEVLDQIRLPQVSSQLASELKASRMKPLLDFIWSNQREFLISKRLGDKESFFSGIMQIIERANIETLSKEDWADFLPHLLSTMSGNIWNMLRNLAQDSIHDMKNWFYLRIQTPLCEGNLTQVEEYSLVRYARLFIGNLNKILNVYRFGPSKPISIASLVKAFLLGHLDNVLLKADADVTTPLYIVGWDGARGDILEPMLREIRFSAETALRSLPEQERVYQVSLKEGKDEESDYALLIVSNTYRLVDRRDIATGYGKKIVQRLADMLGGGAESFEGEHDGRMTYTWKIYLPLWKGSV